MFVPFYIFATVIGLGLVVVGAFAAGHGHGDSDFDHDSSPDSAAHGHDSDGEHPSFLSWFPFFSLRFWTYFFAGAGVVGLLGTYFSQTNDWVLFGSSLGTGLVTGGAATFMFRLLKTHETDSMSREEDLLGKVGTVLVAIRSGELGRIRIVNKGEIIDLIAKSAPGATLELGTEVVVLEFNGNTAVVESKDSVFTQENETL